MDFLKKIKTRVQFKTFIGNKKNRNVSIYSRAILNEIYHDAFCKFLFQKTPVIIFLKGLLVRFSKPEVINASKYGSDS